jgi:hypothetical protein
MHYCCTSLYRVEIPGSVEVIDLDRFAECAPLRGVTFAGNSRLTRICGFRHCKSLHRIEIPPSVEIIGTNWLNQAFRWCDSLRGVVFHVGVRVCWIQIPRQRYYPQISFRYEEESIMK